MNLASKKDLMYELDQVLTLLLPLLTEDEVCALLEAIGNEYIRVKKGDPQ